LIIFLLSGLTQTYGLIPLLIGSVIFAFSKKHNRNQFLPLIGCIPVILLYGLAKYYWAKLLPHETLAYNFGLIKPSLDMANFYLNAWVIFFFPIPIIMIACTNIKKYRYLVNPRSSCVFLTGFSILILAFFYQVKEARYTSFAWPWILIGITILINMSKIKRLKNI
jgi:hypothetical protein